MSRNFLKASLAGLFVVIAAETGSQVDAASTQAAICKYPGVAACRYVCVLFPNGSSCYPNHTSRQNNSCPSVILNGSEWKANSFGFVRRKKRGDWSGGGQDDGTISLSRDLDMNCTLMPLPNDYQAHLRPAN
jgi:hypothetical protein